MIADLERPDPNEPLVDYNRESYEIDNRLRLLQNSTRQYLGKKKKILKIEHDWLTFKLQENSNSFDERWKDVLNSSISRVFVQLFGLTTGETVSLVSPSDHFVGLMKATLRTEENDTDKLLSQYLSKLQISQSTEYEKYRLVLFDRPKKLLEEVLFLLVALRKYLREIKRLHPVEASDLTFRRSRRSLSTALLCLEEIIGILGNNGDLSYIYQNQFLSNRSTKTGSLNNQSQSRIHEAVIQNLALLRRATQSNKMASIALKLKSTSF